jgi:hypothetical protein
MRIRKVSSGNRKERMRVKEKGFRRQGAIMTRLSMGYGVFGGKRGS